MATIQDLINSNALKKNIKFAESPKSKTLSKVNSPKVSEIDVVIGLDFGTSASKVVIQAPDLPGKPCFAVDFGKHGYTANPYLLPSKLWVAPDKTCSLEVAENAKLVTSIKLPLFIKSKGFMSVEKFAKEFPDFEEIAASYLALLLKCSKKWFLEKQGDIIGKNAKINWHLNLGVPTICIEENEEKRIFTKVGKVAWILSTSLKKKAISLNDANLEFKQWDEGVSWEENEEKCSFELIPEIAAGAIGYAKSDNRINGLHLVVDIGASTVDVCCFNLDKNKGDDYYELKHAIVKDLGTIMLYNTWVNAFLKTNIHHIKKNYLEQDPIKNLNEDSSMFYVPIDLLEKVKVEANKRFRKELELLFRDVIWTTKQKRDQINPIWSKGLLPIILIGGGSKMDFFASEVNNINKWITKNSRTEGARIIVPPVLKSLRNLDANLDYHHYFYVAWGLSHLSLDIGNIEPMDKVDDKLRPKPIDFSYKYVSQEMT